MMKSVESEENKKVMEKDKSIELWNWICFILALILFLLWLRFDNTKNISLWVKEVPKLLWCYAWALMGLVIRGVLKLKEKDAGGNTGEKDVNYLNRYSTYGVTLIFLGLFIFSILYLKGLTQSQLFYPLSLAIFSLIGFYAFMLEKMLIRLVK